MFKIIKVIAIWIVGLLLVSILGSFTIPKIENRGLGAPSLDRNFNYYLSLAQWDGGNYIEIAKNGYTNQNYYAFAPLYPLTIKIVTNITKVDHLISGLIISVASFFLFIIFLYKYVAKIKNAKIAQHVALTFIFFPTSFFCIIVYSESLFLLLTILSLYLLEKKNYVASIVISSLVPLARYVGIFVILANSFLLYKKGKSKNLLLGLALAVIPFVSYLAVLKFITGDSFLFSSAQSAWGRFTLDPLTTIFLYITPLFSLQPLSTNNFFDLAILLGFLAILAKNICRLPSNIWIFSMLALIIPATTGTLTGMPRYALASIGAFIVLGEYLYTHPKLKLWLWSASLGLQAAFLALFVTGHWIA